MRMPAGHTPAPTVAEKALHAAAKTFLHWSAVSAVRALRKPCIGQAGEGTDVELLCQVAKYLHASSIRLFLT